MDATTRGDTSAFYENRYMAIIFNRRKTFLLIRDQQYFRSHFPWSNLRLLFVAKKPHFKHFCSIEV